MNTDIYNIKDNIAKAGYVSRQILSNFIKEGDKNFYYYLRMLNLDEESNYIILSKIHHYYYDFNELRNTKIIIHIKELNSISNVKCFFINLSKVISSNTIFIGCFNDDKIYNNKILQFSNFIDWIINNFRSIPNHYMSRKKVTKFLSKNGFKIIDMTEFNTITYFYAKKI
jgi:hypothetical protein